MRDERFFCARDVKMPLNRTNIMGILNLTPDSFSDGGKFANASHALEAARQMLADGADIIDIGGQSTRPGFSRISAGEEWERISEALSLISAETKAVISVDTFYPSVAEKALKAGAHIINDVSGFGNEMLEVASASGAGCVIMYPFGGETGEHGDIVKRARNFFFERKNAAERFGIAPERLCFDPGIGFGKTYEENLILLANPEMYKISDSTLLIGASRKRVVRQAISEGVKTDTEAFERDAGTIGAHTVSQIFGADILRVHNVKKARQAAALADAVMRQRRSDG